MDAKHPHRKKDKYNPYTLAIQEGHCYLSFKDGSAVLQRIEIDERLYGVFDKFELEDISYLNRLSRHIEHSELSDVALNNRAFYRPESLEDVVIKKQEREALHKAIIKLPEIQRRRLLLYFFGGLTYEQIAKLEGCKRQAIQCTIQAALKNLKKILK